MVAVEVMSVIGKVGKQAVNGTVVWRLICGTAIIYFLTRR